MFLDSYENFFIELCKKTADASFLRLQVIADNIANVNTPGFKRAYVEFEYFLRGALSKDYSKNSLKNALYVTPKIYIEHTTTIRADKSNVDLNEELVSLAKTQLLYETILTITNRTFRNLNIALGQMGGY